MMWNIGGFVGPVARNLRLDIHFNAKIILTESENSLANLGNIKSGQKRFL